MPYKVFTNGSVLPASDLNTLMAQSVATFADTAARNAAITAPTEGQMAYTTSDNKYWTYDGAAWVEFGGGNSLIQSTTLSGSSVNFTSIPQTFTHLSLQIKSFRPSTDADLRLQINSNTGTAYGTLTSTSGSPSATTFWNMVNTTQDSGNDGFMGYFNLYNYTTSGSARKIGESLCSFNDGTNPTNYNMNKRFHMTTISQAITSVQLFPSAGTFTSGTVELWGIK